MVYRSADWNPFEFAIVASLRAKQLMAGCLPRVQPANTHARTATLEVMVGKVTKLPATPLALATSVTRSTVDDPRPL